MLEEVKPVTSWQSDVAAKHMTQLLLPIKRAAGLHGHHHATEPIPSVTHSLVTATRRDSIQQQGSLLFGISGVCAVSMCTSSIASGAHTWTTPPYPLSTLPTHHPTHTPQ